ncbi:MAG TPA: hypothetical protein GX706_00070 [Candidatus Moranbacteria bacterium]|nr:hypothetical protein [Candidatus Moranbacteria bacterium]
MKKKLTWLWLTLIILFAVGIRLTPMFFERDMWYDEAFTGVLLKSSWVQMNDFIFRDVHPPLYYWLLWPWVKLFGSSVVGLRSFSLFFGILIIPSAFYIGKKMFNQRAGLLAALICAISPFAIIYSNEARMYSLFALLFIWTVYFFYLALKTNTWEHWVVWGLLSGLCFYTHYLSLFFFLTFFGAAVIWKFLNAPNKNKTPLLSFLKALFLTKKFWVGALIIFLFFISWLKPFMNHVARKGLGWVEVTQLDQLPETIQFFFLGHIPGKIMAAEPLGFKTFHSEFFNYDFGPFLGAGSLGILIMALIAIASTVLWKNNQKRLEVFILTFLSFGSLVLLIFFSWLGIKLFVARYFLPIAILIFVLLAGLITSFNKKAWPIIATLSVYLLALFLQKPMEYNSGWFQVLNKNKAVIENSQMIIVDNPFEYASARYYLGQNKIKLYNQGNPTEDFSLWIIIDNKGKITNPTQIPSQYPISAIAGQPGKSCEWNSSLKKVGQFGQLYFCQEK